MVSVAAYARVSTDRQAESQTIEQQVERLQAYAQQQGWSLPAERIYQDNGESGACLDRPALDRLRDVVAGGAIDVVLITSPDRLARRYAYRSGCWKRSSGPAARSSFWSGRPPAIRRMRS